MEKKMTRQDEVSLEVTQTTPPTVSVTTFTQLAQLPGEGGAGAEEGGGASGGGAGEALEVTMLRHPSARSVCRRKRN